MEDRRFIEETFPVKEVGVQSAREKSIRHGHISTFHTWWARRPLASSRATSFASLIPAATTDDKVQKIKDFVVKLSNWDNSLDRTILGEARKAILGANDGIAPKILDPFAGGGAIPLEAIRLGCDTYASDYNPVSVLILKCTLEYPQKYAGQGSKTENGLVTDKRQNRLLEDVRKWGDWVLQEARKEIGEFYPEEENGSIPVGFIWARTISCQNPACGVEIPLVRQFWLAKKREKKVALLPYVTGRKIHFKIVGTGYEKVPSDFNPDKGTVSGAIATCLACGSVVEAKITRELIHGKKSGQRIVAIIQHEAGGKRYRIATHKDELAFACATEYLTKVQTSLKEEWGVDSVPDEEAPGTVGSNAVGFRYDFFVFGDYFNNRQKLALITFVEKIRQAYGHIIKDRDKEYAKVVTTYLAIILDRLADKCARIVVYNVIGEKIEHVFGRQALQMTWDYPEVNPFTDVGWPNMQDWVEKVLDHCSQVSSLGMTQSLPKVAQCSATSLPHPDNFFDAIFTDPPYYDNVSYAQLSDFFYVWLKRTIGNFYPELFVSPLTPKAEEIIADRYRWNSREKAKTYFEDSLKQSFREIHRVLKPNGVAVIVFAHKSTAAWETLINSLLGSGLVVTAAWPIHTERPAGMRVVEKASLASSIYMVARKMEMESIGFYKEVKDSLRKQVERKLDALWKEGISGADFFIAAIGSSIEVFGKYEKIINDEGSVIRANWLLEDVRRIVTDYAVRQVLHNGFAAEITPLTRFYVLWRWGYGDVKLEFDDALKLARGVGIDITQEWNRGFIKKDKEFVSILGPEDRDVSQLKGSHELIDVLHNVLLLWNKGKNDEAVNILKETGFGKSDVFYRVAQAISESLVNGREKKLLEVFLAGKERITEHVRRESVQRRLFE